MIGILNAYHYDPDPETYQKDYSPMLMDYLRKYFDPKNLKEYMVAQGEFPADINECEGWIITGSPASCYDNEIWIHQLINFVQDCHKNTKKVLGICFGHQLLAHALGGKVEKSNKGWGVGVRNFSILRNTPWMKSNKKDSSLLFSHQDQVTELPPSAKLIATDNFCPNQIFSIDDHIFSIQGHPEFTKEYAKSRYDSRVEALGESVHKEALRSLTKEGDDKLYGQWIKDFFEDN